MIVVVQDGCCMPWPRSMLPKAYMRRRSIASRKLRSSQPSVRTKPCGMPVYVYRMNSAVHRKHKSGQQGTVYEKRFPLHEASSTLATFVALYVREKKACHATLLNGRFRNYRKPSYSASGKRWLRSLTTLPGVTWIKSHISESAGKSYCEFEAPNPEVLRQHAAQVGLPIDKIAFGGNRSRSEDVPIGIAFRR